MYPVRAAKFNPSSASLILKVMFTALLLPVVLAGSALSQDPTDDVKVFSLRDCIGIALGDSPTLMIAEEQRQIASQDVTAAWGNFLPTVSIGYDWQKAERTDYDVEQSSPGVYTIPTTDPTVDVLFPTQIPNGTFADESITTTYKGYSGQARLNIFNGFSKFSRLGSAKSSLKAAEATQEYTQELVVEEVVAAYFNLLRYQRLYAVALETRDQQKLELDRIETYFRLGSAAKSDVLQQRVQLENTKLDVVIADNNVKKAFADLAFTMNLPLAEEFTIDSSILHTDYDVPEVESLYGEALKNRLDIASDQYVVEARKKDVTSATAGIWPSLDVFASLSGYQNDSPYRFGSQRSGSNSFGWSASWNVFDRLQTLTSRSKAKASARIAEYQLQQARLNVQVEVRQLHNMLVEARERANVSKETIIQSEEELRLARERFRVGAGTTLDIIVAQANLANSRAQEVQAMCDFMIYQTRLYRAVGRPYSALLSR